MDSRRGKFYGTILFFFMFATIIYVPRIDVDAMQTIPPTPTPIKYWEPWECPCCDPYDPEPTDCVPPDEEPDENDFILIPYYRGLYEE